MKIVESLKTWIRSEADAVPLALLFLVSPLMPLTTLKRLKEIEYYSYLPDPEDLLEKKRMDNVSGKMREVLEAALQAHQSGSKRIFEEKSEELFSKTAIELKLTEYNISQLFQLASLFTSVIPVTISSILFFTSPSDVFPILSICAILSMLVGGLMGFGVFPRELALTPPPLKSFIMLIGVLVIYIVSSILELERPLLTGVMIGGIPMALVHFFHRKKLISMYKEARELVRRASNASYNIFAALGLEDPEYLLTDRWSSIARSASTALYMLCLYGGDKLGESLQKLELYIGRYLDYLFRIMSKTRTMMFYALIEAAIVSMMYSLTVGSLILLGSEGGIGVDVLMIPSIRTLEEIDSFLDIVMTLNAFGLALATSSAREGQPLYFSVYLPIIAGAMWAGYGFGNRMALSLVSGL